MPSGVRPDWFPDWQGQCAAIVAAGPSVKRNEVDMLKDRIHVVAINTSYELCPWADALYSCDLKWWQLMDYKIAKKQAPKFAGLKVTQDKEAVKLFPDLKKLDVRRADKKPNFIDPICHDFLMDQYGEVGGGGNSGFQVLNWLAQVGVTAVALLGFDMCDFDGKLHWHGRHPDSGPFVLNNPADHNFRGWIKNLTLAAPRIQALGIDVVNCSELSALTCFPKMKVEDVLAKWGL